MNRKSTTLVILICVLFLTACGGQGATETPMDVIEQPAVDAIQPIEAETAVIEPTEPNPVVVEESAVSETQTNVSEITTTAIYTHDGCPDEHFLDVQPDPNNSAYVAPSLTVSCEGQTMTIQTNNIPTFEFLALTPGDLLPQDFSFSLPINPELTDTTTDVPLLGTTGITVAGMAIYGPNEGANLGFGDPYLDGILDFCNGHVGPGGAYHHHAPPSCIFDEYDGQVGLVVGYALDGFPILAPYLCEDASCSSVYEVQSSWAVTNPDATAAWEMHSYVEGQSELDECNGMQFEDGSYAYFATNSFPYFMSCYRGAVEIAQGGGQGQGGQAEGGGQGRGGQGQGSGQGEGGGPPAGNGQQGNQGPPNIDFATAAATLSVTEEALRDALGDPPPDFAAAAAALGVTEQQLQEALGLP
ncbi:MAG: YHYH protein [Chloroflexota bacterium]